MIRSLISAHVCPALANVSVWHTLHARSFVFKNNGERSEDEIKCDPSLRFLPFPLSLPTYYYYYCVASLSWVL